MKNENKRRQFLKNASLSAFGAGLFPSILKASPLNENEAISQSCPQTTKDAYGQGPFYTPNAPVLQAGKLADANELGTKMIISGRVHNLDCSKVIPNTIIDVWHANDAGAYDNSGYNLRGKTTTNSQGFYIFETIKPGRYLNGSTYRPSHIHFKITPPGFTELTTQLYFAGDPYISGDAAASITSDTFDATHRIISLTQNNMGHLEGTWDIIVDGSGIALGMESIHVDKGVIYQANPNPFTDSLEINYGIFQNANVGLMVFDIKGNLIATLEEKSLTPQKYKATWKPDNNLPNGHYFIALKVNDLQVHYLKIIRQK